MGPAKDASGSTWDVGGGIGCIVVVEWMWRVMVGCSRTLTGQGGAVVGVGEHDAARVDADGDQGVAFARQRVVGVAWRVNVDL